jgi:dienelactone hydrolase
MRAKIYKISISRKYKCFCLVISYIFLSTRIVFSKDLFEELVIPSVTNSKIHHFDEPNLVIYEKYPSSKAPLAVLLPGTGGRPENLKLMLQLIAHQGYRAIGLTYDDTPAVNVFCQFSLNPECTSEFRAMRIYGSSHGPIDSPPQEAIVERLYSLVNYLHKQHPADGWDVYLRNQQLAWDHILVSGFSQGAGMAAFIAKRELVYRVVLFSSPWDTDGNASNTPAAWLDLPSKTPLERWWAERHLREDKTDRLSAAYLKLGIPTEHILLFNRDVPLDFRMKGTSREILYHWLTVHDLSYADSWRTMFGRPIE